MSPPPAPPVPTTPIPDVVPIPANLLARWVNLDPNTAVNVTFTKADAEALYFAVKKCIDSQYNIHVALHDAMRGDSVAANGSLVSSLHLLADAQTRLNQFLSNLIAGTLPHGGANG